MSKDVEIVTAFFRRWDVMEEVYAAFREYFRDDTVWENVGMATVIGPEAAIALIKSYGARMPLERFSVEMLNIAAAGSVVLNERVDYVHNAAGDVVGSIRVMGAVEVVDGKIARWRDYFNGSVASAA